MNQSKQQPHLNALLTQNENELCAAIRPDRPPEVSKANPYTPVKSPRKSSVKNKVTTKQQTPPQLVNSQSSLNQQHIEPNTPNMDIDLTMETVKRKTPRRKIQPLSISYDIVTEVLDQPANITIRDLLLTTPKFRRELAGACRIKRKPIEAANQTTMALIEDDDVDTTAVYSKLNIGDKRIRALIDCGAAKTCMSKALADALNLSIDAASEMVFTLGNGTKQPALGIIYDVPITVKDGMTIPCVIEVLPSCPSHLIIGNN